MPKDKNGNLLTKQDNDEEKPNKNDNGNNDIEDGKVCCCCIWCWNNRKINFIKCMKAIGVYICCAKPSDKQKREENKDYVICCGYITGGMLVHTWS